MLQDLPFQKKKEGCYKSLLWKSAAREMQPKQKLEGLVPSSRYSEELRPEIVNRTWS